MHRSSHRGVGGLISIIAVLLIVSFATISLIQLQSKQTDLFSVMSETLELQNKRAEEKLLFQMFDTDSCYPFNENSYKVNFIIDSQWSEKTILDSVVFLNKDMLGEDQFVASVAYNSTEIKSFASNQRLDIHSFNSTGDPSRLVPDSTHVVFITDLGNEFTIQLPADLATRCST